jgi:hypothetical protein
MRKCLQCNEEKPLYEYFERNQRYSRICKKCTSTVAVPDRYVVQTRFGIFTKIKRWITAKWKGLLK